VIASCPIASKLATLGNRAPVPIAVTSTVRPASVAVPGQPRPPWLTEVRGDAQLYVAGGRVVLGASANR
jgi:hypothetical protein